MPKTAPSVFLRKRKLEIEHDLKKNPNDPRYSYFTPKKSKSAVWKNYQVLKFNGCVESYAQCRGCREILSYSSKSGTGSLLRHKCRIKQTNKKNNNNNIQKHISGEDADENDEGSTNDDEAQMTSSAFEDFKESPEHMESSIYSPISKNNDKDDANGENVNFTTCDVTNNTMNSLNMRDKYDAFGENVANEMRLLFDVPDVQFQLKTAILKSILEANTQAHEVRKRRKKN